VNRIGRCTIMFMLLIVALALIWPSALQGDPLRAGLFVVAKYPCSCLHLMVLSVRTVPAGAETKMRADGALWSHADEEKLRALIFAATDIHAIAQKLDRTPLAVRQRAKKLGLTFRKIMRRGCSRPLSIHNLSGGAWSVCFRRGAGLYGSSTLVRWK